MRNPILMKKPLKIALAIPDFKPWGLTSFLNGVKEYSREHNWIFTQCPVNPTSNEDFPLNWTHLKSWHVDGIILLSPEIKQVEMVKKTNIPFVYVGGDLGSDGEIPRVTMNNQMVGRLAAEHLMGLGLKNLSYHGIKDRWYSEERLRGFSQGAHAEGLKIESLCLPYTTRDALWNENYKPIHRWLKSLPLPNGIFAMNDFRSLIIVSACRDIGLRVPEDVATIGADNNLMVCEFSIPTLSSVCVNSYRMGFEAAKLLEQSIQGAPPPRVPVLIDPSEVVARASTDILHTKDLSVKKAIQFLRQNFSEAFKMDAVASAVGVSRRTLETRFRAELNMSLAEFLVNLRVQKAKVMLSNPLARPSEEIARVCGFVNGDNLRAAFRRVLNATPNDFRASKD